MITLGDLGGRGASAIRLLPLSNFDNLRQSRRIPLPHPECNTVARSHPSSYGDLLRNLRLARGYGLREFACVIGDYPSNLSAIEHGERPPWKNSDKLREVAKALGITSNSEEWDRFFLLANMDPNLSKATAKAISDVEVLKATRTIARKKLSREKAEQLQKYLEDL